MPSDKPLIEPDQVIEQAPEVIEARRNVHQSLHRFENNMALLARKIDLAKSASVAWPVLKTTWKTARFVRKNPYILAAAGGIAASFWLYKKIRKPAGPHAK